MNQEFTSKSGAKIVIAVAPWKAAKELKRAIEAEAARNSLPKDFSLDDLSPLFSIALKVDSCPEVDAALWPCLIRCTRNDVKITESTFDDQEARKDYYEIITACVRENFRPFVADLYFLLSALGMGATQEPPKTEENQKSE